MPNARDLCYVAKAIITPGKEFKTEIYSIKRDAERKFIGALTNASLIIAVLNTTVLNATMISCEERDLIFLGQRETLIWAYHNATCSVKQWLMFYTPLPLEW